MYNKRINQRGVLSSFLFEIKLEIGIILLGLFLYKIYADDY